MQVENYYGQQQDGLQHRFIDKVELTGKQILNDPRHFRFFEKDIRRSLTPVFPCAVLYTIEPVHPYYRYKPLCSSAGVLEGVPD